jgi:hypothetical protein
MAAIIDFPEYVNKMDLRQRIAEIARAGLRQRLLFLVGAGFSADARGYPTGAGLASILVRQTYECSEAEANAAAAKYELAAISQQFTERATEKRQGLVEHIAKALSRKPATRPQAELDLASVAAMCRLRRIFTTNFDDVIEDALDKRSRPVKATVADIRKFEDEANDADVTGVFHLNGNTEDPKVTEDELRTHRSVFYELFRRSLLTDVLVMVGYSFRDDAIVRIYDELFDLLKTVGQDRRNYIVMPTDNQLDYLLAERLWRARGDIVLIPVRAGQFFRMLVTALEEARYSEAVTSLAGRVGASEAEVTERLSPYRDKFAHVSLSELTQAVEELMKSREV